MVTLLGIKFPVENLSDSDYRSIIAPWHISPHMLSDFIDESDRNQRLLPLPSPDVNLPISLGI